MDYAGLTCIYPLPFKELSAYDMAMHGIEYGHAWTRVWPCKYRIMVVAPANV